MRLSGARALYEAGFPPDYSGATDILPQSEQRRYRMGSDSDRPMMRAPATPHLGQRTAGGGRFAMVDAPLALDASGLAFGRLCTVELPFTLSFYYVCYLPDYAS